MEKSYDVITDFFKVRLNLSISLKKNTQFDQITQFQVTKIED